MFSPLDTVVMYFSNPLTSRSSAESWLIEVSCYGLLELLSAYIESVAVHPDVQWVFCFLDILHFTFLA